MKKETLEEAFEKWSEQFPKGYEKLDVLRFGANWQQERSYSEEEIKSAFIDGSNNPIEEDDAYGTEFFKYMDKWFKQFKKK